MDCEYKYEIKFNGQKIGSNGITQINEKTLNAIFNICYEYKISFTEFTTELINRLTKDDIERIAFELAV